MCSACRTLEVEWREAPSDGHIFTYTFVNHRFVDVPGDMAPYVTALIELDTIEDLRVVSRIVGYTSDDPPSIGDRVRFSPVRRDAGYMPAFALRRSSKPTQPMRDKSPQTATVE